MMFDRLKSWMRGSADISAATQLPVVAPPKVKPGEVTIPSYLKTARPGAYPLPLPDRNLASTDVTTLRSGGGSRTIIHDFAASSPDLAAAKFAYLRVGIPSSYTAIAKNPDGTFNPEATSMLHQVIMRMDMLPDYSQGYACNMSLRSCAEALAGEIILYGAMSSELVLDKTRLPLKIQPCSVVNIKFQPDPKDLTLIPIQYLGGVITPLDIPTFFYTSLDQDLLNPYSDSFLEPAIKAVIFSEDFIADIHRVVKRAVHPRVKVVIDYEKFAKGAPSDAQHDESKMQAYMAQIISDLENKINGLRPEDALVYFDVIEVGLDNNGSITLSKEYETLQNIANAKLSTGAKATPTILGHGVGSQNIASTESMLFVKNATGAVKCKLDEHFSRIFTLAVRLFGYDVVVEFSYDEIDLRPDSELESFKSQKQSRILELLSLGLMSDEEASIKLTGKLPPQGYKPLSGTMFRSATIAEGGTDVSSNNGSALNQSLNPDTPTGGGRGDNTKANPVKQPAKKAEVLSLVQEA